MAQRSPLTTRGDSVDYVDPFSVEMPDGSDLRAHLTGAEPGAEAWYLAAGQPCVYA